MVGSGLQPDFEYDYKCFLNVILNIFEILMYFVQFVFWAL